MVGYKYTRTMGLSMGGQSDHNTIRIPALCHKLFRTMKNKIIKLEGKTFCTIYFRLGPAIATVKALAHLSHRRWWWWDRSWSEVHVGAPAAEMARPGLVSWPRRWHEISGSQYLEKAMKVPRHVGKDKGASSQAECDHHRHCRHHGFWQASIDYPRQGSVPF